MCYAISPSYLGGLEVFASHFSFNLGGLCMLASHFNALCKAEFVCCHAIAHLDLGGLDHVLKLKTFSS